VPGVQEEGGGAEGQCGAAWDSTIRNKPSLSLSSFEYLDSGACFFLRSSSRAVPYQLRYSKRASEREQKRGREREQASERVIQRKQARERAREREREVVTPLPPEILARRKTGSVPI